MCVCVCVCVVVVVVIGGGGGGETGGGHGFTAQTLTLMEFHRFLPKQHTQTYFTWLNFYASLL